MGRCRMIAQQAGEPARAHQFVLVEELLALAGLAMLRLRQQRLRPAQRFFVVARPDSGVDQLDVRLWPAPEG